MSSPTPAGLPDIPECSVARGDDGRIHVTHKRTGRTAIAKETAEDLIIQGAILRCLATYPWLRHSGAGDVT